ncbi:hypothetical protein ES702_06561 [subsurface metagenome]
MRKIRILISCICVLATIPVLAADPVSKAREPLPWEESNVTDAAKPSAASTPKQPEVSYLCVADLATGFRFDKTRKKWVSTDFSVDNKYIVSKGSSYSSYRQKKDGLWEVKDHGVKLGHICADDFSRGVFICSSSFEEFRMDRDGLRFIHFYKSGYWGDNNTRNTKYEGDNTPAITIGRCSPL